MGEKQMTTAAKPAVRPDRAHFSSGPCAKRPGWSPDNLKLESLGRSHRSKLGKSRLKLAIDKTRAILRIPADYRIGIMPGSDTGAIEAAFSLLTIRDQLLPPTINHEEPDPAITLDVVPNVARAAKVSHVLSNSFGFGGQNVCLVISGEPA
jgi:phosphoserine aminotransferase